MDEIGTFLARAVPWPTESTPGYVNIHYPWVPPDLKPGEKPPMPGRAFTDLAAAKRYVDSRKHHSDLYLCMSLQSEIKGQDKRGLRARRRQKNVVLIQSLYIDVDIKDGFFYSTQHAAEECERWRVSVGLPDWSMLVLTGSGGFHAYITFNTPVSREIWQPLADALANAAMTFKPLPLDGKERLLDLGVTVDPTRILRIPGTLNFKHAPPKPASLAHVGESYDVAVIERALERFKGKRSSNRSTARRTFKTSSVFKGMAEPPPLDEGITSPIPVLENVMEVCPWIRRVAETGGSECSEPEWRNSLVMAWFCQNGREVAHYLSSAHPGYTVEATDQKFDRVAESHMGNKNLGWPQCQTMWLQAKECKTCPHLAEEKSPFNFVTLQSSPPPAQDDVPRTGNGAEQPLSLPRGYTYAPDGHILRRDSQGKSQRVTDYLIRNIRPYAERDDGSGNWSVSFDVDLDAKRSKTISIPYEAGGKKLTEYLLTQGMWLNERGGRNVRELMASFVEQLHARKIASAESEPYGWSVIDGKRTGVVCFDRRFNCSGVQSIASSDIEVSKKYRPTGSLDIWKYNAKLITQQKRPDLDIIIAAAFGGILVPMTGIDGVVLAAFSPESGLGKSHCMRIGQGVWAQPVTAMASVSDTANFVIKKLGVLRNIPFFFDEVKLATDMDTVVGMIFSMTQGKTKGRLSANLETREVLEFSTLLAVASNDSLTDYINEHIKTSTAGLNRIYEIPVQPNTSKTGLISKTDAQKSMGQLRDNYGHAGLVYCEFLGKNIDAVENMVTATSTALEEMVKATNDERFWLATMAVCYVGAHLANRLKLVEIDEAVLLEYMVQNFYRLRALAAGSYVDITKAQSCERYVQDYVNANHRRFLITDKVPSGPGRVAVGKINALGNTLEFKDGVRVRYAYEDKLLRWSSSDFREWLRKERRVGPSQIVEALKRTMGVTIEKMNLGAPLIPGSREEVFQLDTADRPGFINLNDILDEGESDDVASTA